MTETRALLRWAIGLPVLRVLLVAAASATAWLLIGLPEGATAFPPPPLLAAVAMLPINIVCLVLVARLLARDGRRIRDLLDLRRGRVVVDLLWGLLWIAVLYLPFVATLMFAVWLQHGDGTFTAMETIFFDPDSIPALDPIVWTVLAIVGVLTFAPLNAPVEELVYRGYAQRELARRLPLPLAIALSALVFAVQHLWYAPTPDAAVAFACAFFVWGLGSGIIYQRQRRLMPLIFAHGLVNLFSTLPALFIPFAMNGA